MRRDTGRSVFALILTSAVFAAAASYPGIACSCDTSITFSTGQELDRHEMVFAGVLEEVFPLSLSWLQVGEQPVIQTTIARFRVTQVWKGVSGSEVEVFSAAPGGSCGYPLREGVAYVVFAKQDQMFSNAPRLGVSRCSPTAPLADAARRVKQLNRVLEKRARKSHDS